MAVVGAGVVGLCCAWLLQRKGHRVLLIDPSLAAPGLTQKHALAGGSQRSGSGAALGVLMAQVFHRSRGRAWNLRQQSLALWHSWLQELAERGQPVPRRQGLLWLAAEPEEWQRQQALVAERQQLGLALELWDRERLSTLQPALPAGAIGALHSPLDGQIDPPAAMAALLADGCNSGLATAGQRVGAIERDGPGRWRLLLEGGEVVAGLAHVVLAAGLASPALLQSLGSSPAMEPVLGQALALRRSAPGPWTWPGVAVWRGLNLVPRPDLGAEATFWLGATLEAGSRADPDQQARLRHWGDAGLDWLEQASVVEAWQGCRARPVGRPAPLHEQLQPGLWLVSGHYRNGVLLAPASAAWVLEQIEQTTPRP